MGNTLYLECYSGISGDMTVAALLDLGADEKVLREVLESLPVGGFQVRINRVKKSGIDACDFDVVLDGAHENHDHDMEYLHGHRHGAGCAQEHHHEHGHSHSHVHRGMKEIREIIGAAHMTDRARATALRIFGILAQAEAKAHNVPVEEVHFHEVGAVDSIVDILSAAVCLDNLDITDVIVPCLFEGQGTVRCQHGILPIPVPAVANIVSAHGLNLRITEVEGELVTPTGAAIAAAVMTDDTLPESFTIEKIGVGAGKRQYRCPGILRAMLIHPDSQEPGQMANRDTIYKLETNIDDCSGETLGYVMGKLLDAGARDVHYTPVYMKKNRPAWLVTVICTPEDIPKMEEILFAETTTIGIRRIRMERTILMRREETVSTPYGEVRIKICGSSENPKYYPEYESLAAICRASGLSYPEAYRIAAQAAQEKHLK